MTGTYNQVITTFVWPDNRSIECQSINKTIYQGEALKIIGIYNPNFAGTFGNTVNGFKIEVLQQTTTIVLEQLYVTGTVTIQPGSLTGRIVQSDNFIQSDSTYTLYLSLLNALSSSNSIKIRFPSTFLLYNSQCSVISGITLAANTGLTCLNYSTSSYTYLNVSNFLSATVSTQLVFSILVNTPSAVGTYPIYI